QLSPRSPRRPSHRRFRFASFSVFRFGEAVFTDTRKNPQEEKTAFVTIFCQMPRQTQVLLRIFL
ncbi:MAG: hypothetical protein KA139_07565, partial [Rhodobacteraceae bacterium]|nr:hypothetical protein [Paracoccaceae bacterium]